MPSLLRRRSRVETAAPSSCRARWIVRGHMPILQRDREGASVTRPRNQRVPMSKEVLDEALRRLEREAPHVGYRWTRAVLLAGFSFLAFLGLVRLIIVIHTGAKS
jgi:hypothetical protein